MNKAEAKELLRCEKPEEVPVMLHGTSYQSAVSLIVEGEIPCPKETEGDHPVCRGYMFFAAIKDSFQGHPLYDQCFADFDEAWDTARWYALDLQRRAFCEQFEMEGDFHWSDILLQTKRDTEWEERLLTNLELDDANIDGILDYGPANLRRNLIGNRGVILGINEEIFKCDIKLGPDMPQDEVMIPFLEGFPAKYVEYIYPRGLRELSKIRQAIDSLV